MANVAPKQDADTVRRLLIDIQNKNFTVGCKAVYDLAEKYQEKYATWFNTCHLYHVMIGSTPYEVTDADFPGDDSVITRLKDILDTI
ncbi:hypothetical protein HYW84_01955 [Candidatus Peregrinibacteria bacterium]|nr:hypothetical protein [Candidatus Peregrinibacteria bacterium]